MTEELRSPRLRTVEKAAPPYPMNKFPAGFPYRLGREIVYHLATKPGMDFTGEMWEQVFAKCIDGEWKPSNVGLDDVVLGQCAWGAKTVKTNPVTAKTCRLISGRNSPVYSFGESKIAETDPNETGGMVLQIWNERVSGIRKKFKHLRTVVLMKGPGLLTLGVFELETVRFEPERFTWQWNTRNNLEGFDRETDNHKFTWQPHGSQFTIVEPVPDESLLIKLKEPSPINQDSVLDAVGFDNSWVTILKGT